MLKEYSKLIQLLILLFVVVFISFVIKNYFNPFLYIVVLYLLAKPLQKFFLKVTNSFKLSAAFSIIVLNLLLFVVVFYLSNNIIVVFQKYVLINIDKLRSFYNDFLNLVTVSNNNPGGHIGNSIIDGSIIKKGALYTSESIVSYVIANICVYFVLVDEFMIRRLFYVLLPKNIVLNVGQSISKLKKLAVIEVMLALFSTVETFFGFIFFKVPEPFLLALICGALDILPYVGTIIVFIPLIIYNIVLKEYFIAIGLVILYILIQINREILETKFIGDRLDIHPILALLSIYIGVKLFGVIGIISGPLYVLLAKNIIISSTQEEFT
ncbi:AI-2E family transporter [Clostridium manihotivorum]|uniref:AI-2E family transporter n=1 Tax=Clostridium manihotivorum TaxID=2320868 RepID=A0A3R5QZK3_9CLOT|nr:AI-2E family transporter [Clostridium manihotivorum]QAA33216.1 AI-2E family transporter [Clostridium manihotivorum]